MSGYNIFRTDRPTQRGMAGARLQPMTRQDRRFWRLIRERHPHLYEQDAKMTRPLTKGERRAIRRIEARGRLILALLLIAVVMIDPIAAGLVAWFNGEVEFRP